MAIAVPDTVPWSGTFGSVLCSHAGDDDIRLEGIRLETPTRPIDVRVTIRTVRPSDLVGRSARELRDSAPFGSKRGSPPRYGHSAGRAALGSYTAGVEGVVVTEDCDASLDASNALVRGRPSETSLTELLFTLRVGRRGGSISDAFLDYTAGGTAYTLHIRWQMIACGSAITDRSLCSPAD